MAAAVLPPTTRPIRGQQLGGMRGPRSDDGASTHRLGYFDKYPARATPGRIADDEGAERFSAPASLNGHAPPPRRTRGQRSGSTASDVHIQTESAKYEWPYPNSDIAPLHSIGSLAHRPRLQSVHIILCFQVTML
jgi:hypothetical protein